MISFHLKQKILHYYILKYLLKPLNAGDDYICLFIFFYKHISNMLEIKRDVEQDLKMVDFVNHVLETHFK